MNHTG